MELCGLSMPGRRATVGWLFPWQVGGTSPAPSPGMLTKVGAVGDDEPLLPVLQTCGHAVGGQPSGARWPRLGSWPSSHPGQESTKVTWDVSSPHGLSLC